MIQTLRRIAVLNRGEPAVRFVRALNEYNIERGTDLEAIALYTPPDARAPFVRMAHEAHPLGETMLPDSTGAMVSAYCHHDHVVQTLKAHQCDAVWPGWGFASEDQSFVARLEQEGIVFLGPSSHAMGQLGDKVESKHLAGAHGVPLAPWSMIDPQAGADTWRALAQEIGYPLVVKASAGGGGRGIRRVDEPDKLEQAIQEVDQEVRKVFGQGTIFMEKCITGARHIEVQLVAGADGQATAVGIRDCSMQRRNQKVIEEAPSPILPEAQRARLFESTQALLEAAKYQGVATAEFLYDPKQDELYFLEVNSRLQVEHTITELLTGCDLVQAQIDIARGLPWDKPQGPPRGHAIEVRLNAEDPEQNFRPSPGIVRVFAPPSGPGVRVDSGVEEGLAIAPEFDSMIAKVIVWAPTRSRAIARMIRALHELQVIVEDGAVNKDFLLELLEHPAFVEATADTSWIDRAMVDKQLAQPKHEYEALIAAAIIEYRNHRDTERRRFFAQVQNGIPQQLPAPEGLTLELKMRGHTHTVEVYEVGAHQYLAGPNGTLQHVGFDQSRQFSSTLTLDGHAHQVLYTYGRAGMSLEVDGSTHTVELASGGTVKAPAPAMVVHVGVEAGDVIEAGSTLCTLEAMKMEMPVFAPQAGTVKEVLIMANQQVTAGQPLVIMAVDDAQEDTAEQDSGLSLQAASTHPIDVLFDGDTPRPERMDELDDAQAQAVIDDLTQTLQSVLLGFDQSPTQQDRAYKLLDSIDASTLRVPERWRALHNLLFVFTDTQALFERTLLPVTDAPSSLSIDAAFYEFCRHIHEGEDGARAPLRPLLLQALRWYEVTTLDPSDPLRAALWRLAVRHRHTAAAHHVCSLVLRTMMNLHAQGVSFEDVRGLGKTLGRLTRVVDSKHYPFVADNARQASYVLLSQSQYVERPDVLKRMLASYLDGARVDSGELLALNASAEDALVESPHSLMPLLLAQAKIEHPALHMLLGRVIARRLYRLDAKDLHHHPVDGPLLLLHTKDAPKRAFLLIRAATVEAHLDDIRDALRQVEGLQSVDISLLGEDAPLNLEHPSLRHITQASWWSQLHVQDVVINWSQKGRQLAHWHLAKQGDALVATAQPSIHPDIKRRFELHRFEAFRLEQLVTPERIYAFMARAHSNPKDERLVVFAELTDAPSSLEDAVWRERILNFERVYFEALKVVRDAQAKRSSRNRLHWNTLVFHVIPVLTLSSEDITTLAQRFESKTTGLGIRSLQLRANVPTPDGSTRPIQVSLIKPSGQSLNMTVEAPETEPIQPMSPYEMRVVRTKRWGMFYPYEVVRMIEGALDGGTTPHPDLGTGSFQEYDLDAQGALAPVERPYGENTCGVVVGVVSNPTPSHPEGIKRVWIASDATYAMGALSEPECARILAAIDLAQELELPIEWLPISAGARISMDSGTENLDWTAQVLKSIVRFTQRGGTIHLIVTGVNVGAQSYWNAEATMLMHTRGILIMTPDGSMVLTGKKALDYSGSVSAEDERGIGGYERIMGQNGQAQYFAQDLGHAYALLMDHYRLTYKAPGEPTVRRATTSDPHDRDVNAFPYQDATADGFNTVGEVLSVELNRERKKPFAIREIMRAVVDQDAPTQERFKTMKYAETAVVWDASIGGFATCVIGVESKPQPRHGRVPVDGPDAWSGGTLFPQSSKKVARALNAASGNRPVVVLANLSGFDGSPESLRKLQLEYGAEIGRAVVNFEGPIVFVVIGRYHGGAYVVFSKALNDNLTAYALEGTYASVIGGAPAAAVVFSRQVLRDTDSDPTVHASKRRLDEASDEDKPLLRERHDTLYARTQLQKQGELAAKFDSVHNVQRAVEVGSLDAVIQANQLRPTIIRTLEDAQP